MRFKTTSKSIHRSILASAIDHPWGIAFVLCTATSAVAYAQATIIPASPVPDNTAAVAPVAAQQDMPQQTGLINLNFVDVPVVQLITMIAQQGNVGIIIGSDVDDKSVIRYINLKDETPQDAIKKAALAAGLRWEKVDPKTYMVGKNLPDVDTSAQNTPAANSNLPVLPFGAPTTDTNNSIIPPAISQAANSNGAVYTPMPDLGPMGSDVTAANKDKPTYTVIKVRNVPASTLAWWIDPTHQPKPPEYRAAEIGIEQSINPHPVRPAVDPNIMAQLNGNGIVNPYSTYNPYNPNPYASPYQASPISYGPYNQFNQPYFQSAAQFGGGGGGFGGGGNRGGGGSNSSSEGVLEAPKGIGTIISIDAQNALLVYGTADGVAQLRQIIDFLDRPIRQVEIEAQFVDIGTTDANAFGLSFSTNSNLNNNNDTNAVTSNFGTVPSTSGGTSLTATFGHYQATLNALVSNKKARIVNSPRVTTLNNLTAFLFSATATPIVLTSTTSGIGGQVGEQQNAFFLTTSIGLIVTPTINNDDTITVFLTPQVQVQTPVQTTSTGGSSNNNNSSNSSSSGASSIPAFTSQYMTTVAIVKDGDTIVLGGLRTKNVSYTENSIPILSKLPIIGGLFKSKQLNDDDDELVIFLTARILHRPDDLAPLPGT